MIIPNALSTIAFSIIKLKRILESYTKEGTLFYNEPYKYKYNIDDPYWVQEPYYDRYGFLQYRTVTKYNRKTYWGTSYRQKECKFVRNFSIYDISDKISLFENRDSAYKRLIKEFNQLLLDIKEDHIILISSHILSEIQEICDYGGDTDTNAAIVGTVIGPLIGFKNFGDETISSFLKFDLLNSSIGFFNKIPKFT